MLQKEVGQQQTVVIYIHVALYKVLSEAPVHWIFITMFYRRGNKSSIILSAFHKTELGAIHMEPFSDSQPIVYTMTFIKYDRERKM